MRPPQLSTALFIAAASLAVPSNAVASPPPPIPHYFYGCLTVGPYTSQTSLNWWREIMIYPTLDPETMYTLGTFPA